MDNCLFSGVLDEKERLTHPDVQHLHVHRRREVQRRPPRPLGRLEPEGGVRPEEGLRYIRMPGEHRTEDKPGDPSEC